VRANGGCADRVRILPSRSNTVTRLGSALFKSATAKPAFVFKTALASGDSLASKSAAASNFRASAALYKSAIFAMELVSRWDLSLNRKKMCRFPYPMVGCGTDN
jgi:hypothetical protein